MPPRRLSALAGLVVLSFASSVLAAGRAVDLHVVSPDGRPVAGVRLGLQGGPSEWTDAAGQVRLRPARESGWVTLQTVAEPGEPEAWVFLEPSNRGLRLSAAGRGEAVRVVLGRKGDRAMLLGSPEGRQAALRSILFSSSWLDREDLAARAKRRRVALGTVATSWGLPPAEIDRALRTAASRSRDPYEQGLAALYLEDWARAAKLTIRPRFLAEALYRLGRTPEALAAFTVYTGFLNDPAQALNDLGVDLYGGEDYPSAEWAFRQALRKSYPKSSEVFRWTIRSNLASAVEAQGRLQGVRKMQEAALAVQRRALGNNHPNTLGTIAGLADTLELEGDLAAAFPLREELVATYRRLQGPEAPDTVRSMNNFSVTLLNLGDPASARRLIEQILAIRRRTLGEDHPSTLRTETTLATLLGREGDLAGERRLEEQILAVLQKRLGNEHEYTLDVMANLTNTLRLEGHLAKALALGEQVVAARVHRFGPRHSDTSLAQWALLNLRKQVGDEPGARLLAERLAWLQTANAAVLSGQQREIRAELRGTAERKTAPAGEPATHRPKRG